MLFRLQKLSVIKRENKFVQIPIKAAAETSAIFPARNCAKKQQINKI